MWAMPNMFTKSPSTSPPRSPTRPTNADGPASGDSGPGGLDSDPTMGGYFYKRGKDSLSLKFHSVLDKKRFCVIQDGILKYYTSHARTTAKGEINLARASSADLQGRTLTIKTESRDWILTALDADQAIKWHAEINRLIGARERKAARTPEIEPDLVDPDADGKGGLREASSRGNVDAIRGFVTDGADVNEEYPESGGSTPLTLAVGGGHAEAAKLLIASGASVNYRNTSDGSSPLYIAARTGSEAVTALLLESQANVETRDDDGTTPLWIAAQNGHACVIGLLIDGLAEVNAADDEGVTPMHIAARKGRDPVVQMLLEAGGDVESADEGGTTVLIGASREGFPTVVHLLLKANADYTVEGPFGPALQEALWRGHADVAAVLRAVGATCGADAPASPRLSDCEFFSKSPEFLSSPLSSPTKLVPH